MKTVQFILSLACAGTALAAPAAQSTTGTSISSTTTEPSGTGTATGISQCQPTGAFTSWLDCLALLAVNHDAPHKNGTSNSTSALSGTASPTTASPTTFSTSTTTTASSTSTSSTATPSPTGTWNDSYGDINADSFSVLILPGTKNLLVKTFSNHEGVKYYNLDCPGDGDDFETIGGAVKDMLPHELKLHAGNVCSGSWKIGASFDNTWIEYSTLDRINVPTSSSCTNIGSSKRCILPLDPK